MKKNSSAARHKMKYGSTYIQQHGGFNNSHFDTCGRKANHESNGISYGGAYSRSRQYEHSKIAHHSRINSPTRGRPYLHYHANSFDNNKSSFGGGNSGYTEAPNVRREHSPHGFSQNIASYGAYSEDYGGFKGNKLFKLNEKETMQSLNERLASYLEKVRTLEQENAQLEKKIFEWYEKNAPSALPDTSQYFKTIEELQKKIFSATVENSRTALLIDNSKWAADDFSNKYDIEIRLRNNVEADIKGLRNVLEGLSIEKSDLEIHAQDLQEEVEEIKKNHTEEVNSLRGQLGARVNVEVNAAPSADLNKVLSDVREEYENLMDRNLRDVEAMFLTRTEELSRQVQSSSENLQSVQIEIIDLKRTVQNLEIDLMSQINMKSALEETLTETEANYSSELAQLQKMICHAEDELAQIRRDLERQNLEYRTLMDQKNLLEKEIATYKQLIDGHDDHLKENRSAPVQDRSTATQDRSTATQDRSTPAQDRSTQAQDRSTPAQDRSTPAQDRSIQAQTRFTPTQDRFSSAQTRSTPGQDRSTPAQGRSTPAQDRAPPPNPSRIPNSKDSNTTDLQEAEQEVYKPSD